MDLIEEVHNVVDKQNWDKLNTARYLYLKSCECCCYDYRYYIHNEDFNKIIRSRKIDLHNFDDPRIVCESWSNEVYIPLLKEFNIDCSLVGSSRAHQFVSINIDKLHIIADACIYSDTARVKTNNNTKGFYSDNIPIFDEIRNIDINIGYIKDLYFKEKILQNGVSSSSLLMFFDNYFIDTFYNIKDYIDNLENVKTFTDTEFTINYLMIKYLSDIFSDKIKQKTLYDPSDDSWNLKVLYTLDGINKYYFLLEDNNYYDKEKCNFYEITESQAQDVVKQYKYKF